MRVCIWTLCSLIISPAYGVEQNTAIHTDEYTYVIAQHNNTKRKPNEDRYDSVEDRGNGHIACAVYDGHGGQEAAETLANGNENANIQRFLPYIMQNLNNIRDACTNWDNMLLSAWREQHKKKTSGSTVSGAALDFKHDIIQPFNLGDSRTMLIYRDTSYWTTDDDTAHKRWKQALDNGGQIRAEKADRKDVKNINNAPRNGIEVQYEPCGQLHKRAYRHGTKRQRSGHHEKESTCIQELQQFINTADIVRCSGLQPACTIGDFKKDANRSNVLTKRSGIQSQPYYAYPADKLSECNAVVIATDGIWDAWSEHTLRDTVTALYRHNDAPHTLADMVRDIINGSQASTDDKTIIVLFPDRLKLRHDLVATLREKTGNTSQSPIHHSRFTYMLWRYQQQHKAPIAPWRMARHNPQLHEALFSLQRNDGIAIMREKAAQTPQSPVHQNTLAQMLRRYKQQYKEPIAPWVMAHNSGLYQKLFPSSK